MICGEPGPPISDKSRLPNTISACDAVAPQPAVCEREGCSLSFRVNSRVRQSPGDTCRMRFEPKETSMEGKRYRFGASKIAKGLAF